MATRVPTPKKVTAPVVAPPQALLALWWRPWMMGLGCWLLMVVATSAAQAQQASPPAAPKVAKEAEAAPLPAKKLEEALQLLLKATKKDSSQVATQRRRFRPTEIEGLVMDQTITKVGHDFYDAFYSIWEAPADAGDFTILIQEKPARGTSTLISVTVNDSELLELPLQPKPEVIEETASYAFEVTTQFLLQARNDSRLLEQNGNRQPAEVF
ncbi:curli production assembly/transport protein CsgE [Hymenobacter cellulosilyticus]|uniref:Curli production assembly/transport component CsgE n=1 Tax=Hymenobacter cellulosilyticus TaxID=2932248 RepID=A0A8T9Q7B6_9BACT|nr:curli production assembly/transport protein CsgE [Hymenobacter cellulosilyticus]UOQ71670.1 curli production assembly/transport protein CsgE [Hymenobacter cellulosilyticus]